MKGDKGVSKKVVILGGGVAGLSAAHELCERGFQVAVYELKGIPGGKARSFPVPDSGTDGRAGWPAEHGFRFLPRYYRNLPDTMKRIPFASNRRGVYDNLIQLDRLLIAPLDSTMTPTVALVRFPRSLQDLKIMLHEIEVLSTQLTPAEIELFAVRMWQIFTSCRDRRLADGQKISWWDYLDADSQSEMYQKLIAKGLSQALVAANPKLANTFVLGDIIAADLLAIGLPGKSFDRVLNGPTNDAWIEPWLNYLRSRGVEYHLEHELVGLDCDTEIRAALVRHQGTTQRVTGDYYIAALPVEVMRRILLQDVTAVDGVPVYKNVLKADPTLASILTLGKSVAWMNGIMFYLKTDIQIVRGHIWMPGTPWSLTAISEPQLWPRVNMSDRGDGQALGLISVVVSDWDSPGLHHGPAKFCTAQQIKEEVWEQMKQSLNSGGVILRDEDLYSSYLDPDIVPEHVEDRNAEPLYISALNTWYLQPEAHTAIPNFFLASDYVHTNIQLATMEGANEAARQAVNSIIDKSGVCAPYCRLETLLDPDPFFLFRQYDQYRFDRGLPWSAEPPFLIKLLEQVVMMVVELVTRILNLFAKIFGE